MTRSANQMHQVLPNILQGVPQPNTLSGLSRPETDRRSRSDRPYIAAASVGIAMLALVLLQWRR